MKTLAAAIIVFVAGLSPALAQSATPDGRPINPEGISDPAGRPVNPVVIGQRSSAPQPATINPADDPFGILRDPAGRPIKPDGIGDRAETEKRGS